MTALKPESRFADANAVLRALDGDDEHVVTLVSETPSGSVGRLGLIAVGVLTLAILAGAVALTKLRETQTPVEPTALPEPRRANPLNVQPEPEIVVEDLGLAPELPSACARPPLVEGRGVITDGLVTADIALPDSYDGKTPHPVVLIFNAGEDHVPTDALDRTKFHEPATRRGYVVVAAFHNAVFDMAWINVEDRTHAVLNFVRDEICIAPGRLYGLGTGNGGWPIEALRCELDALAVDRYTRARHTAGIQTFVAPPLEPCDSEPPYLHLIPTEDCHWGVDGGQGCNRTFDRTSVEEQMQTLKALSGCEGEASPLPTKHARCRSWSCQAHLESCVIDGKSIWRDTKFDASNYILDFFDSAAPKDQ